jgi:hypothetical protein
MQRNFIAWYLNGSRGGKMKDAALVAFFSPSEADWRFSLVRMDYRFEVTKDGKVKVKEEFTPARRWSFLVGEQRSQPHRQSRLVNILADDEHNPTLKQLEEAFNIETVTKEFLIKYRELFIVPKKLLIKVVEQDDNVKIDFDAKGVDTVTLQKNCSVKSSFSISCRRKAGLEWQRMPNGARAPKIFYGSFSKVNMVAMIIFSTIFSNPSFMRRCATTAAMTTIITAGSTARFHF